MYVRKSSEGEAPIGLFNTEQSRKYIRKNPAWLTYLLPNEKGPGAEQRHGRASSGKVYIVK